MVVHHIHFTHVGFMALSGICTFSCEHAACVWITHVVLVTAFPDTVVGMNLKWLPYATLEYFLCLVSFHLWSQALIASLISYFTQQKKLFVNLQNCFSQYMDK